MTEFLNVKNVIKKLTEKLKWTTTRTFTSGLNYTIIVTIKKNGKTFKYTNGAFTEFAQSTHGFRVVGKLGTPIHEKNSLRSITCVNSTRKCSSLPLRLRNSPQNSCPSTSFHNK